jgi:hypothetical protein
VPELEDRAFRRQRFGLRYRQELKLESSRLALLISGSALLVTRQLLSFRASTLVRMSEMFMVVPSGADKQTQSCLGRSQIQKIIPGEPALNLPRTG